ncbi:TonB-dependent receptor [Alteromonas sp. D210916BOD_24]|uniref:TonB-dependent receptor domain-containing protein n=1 Tax=Alteromonas sp. D210916BOD_24 TaxID=3157618 RepID=UPI00399CB8EA
MKQKNKNSWPGQLIYLFTSGILLVPNALAQDTEEAEPAEVELIQITGSNIKGAALDAALPLEIYYQEDLEKQGSPTALEFAKSLTISGPTTGESYYFGGPALTGSVNYNLRGIGADKTLILLNGRRTSLNTSNIPSIALSRTEILKDGAAVIYGADATGGVVNFITRRDFTGLEANVQYKAIDGSDGDYSVALLGGFGEDTVNFMWSAEYEHRSRLSTLDRDFSTASLDPTKEGYNPAPWSTLTNMAGWVTRGALPTIPSATADGEWGAPLGLVSDFTPESCAAVGGRYDNAYTCAYNYIPFYRLVEEQDIFRGYAQLNAEVTDTVDFHMNVSYGQVSVPQVMGSPAQPIIRGPALAPGLIYQFYVPISNPYAAQFAQENDLTGVQGFTPITYRLMAHGGNPFIAGGDGYGVPDDIENRVWRLSTGLSGELGAWAGVAEEVAFDAAITYNYAYTSNTHADTIGYRLQEALYGFGGASCNAQDLDPSRFGTQNPDAAGKNGCMYWNPFASSFTGNPMLGTTNPNYRPGSENNAELAKWLFDPREVETISDNLTIDLVFNGGTGVELPGGEIMWAVGGQYRTFKTRESVDSEFLDGSIPCAWPDSYTSANGEGSPNLEANPVSTTDPTFRGCTPDSPGPFVLFATDPADAADREQYSLFLEWQLPITDDIDLQAAARKEEFSGGLGATVYKVAGKWSVMDGLTLRGSFGTNYQTPPMGVIPGAVTVGARTYTVAANNWLAAQFVTDEDLEPETATTWNLGFVWQNRGFASNHDFRFIVDYFDIETEDQIGEVADPNQIASLVFNGEGGTITTCDPTVQPLLNRVAFNDGCSVGMSAIGAFSSITTQFGNGPGQTTSGLDIQAAYSLPVSEGLLSIDLTATRVLELKTGSTELDGVEITAGDDRLGTLNFATFAQAAPKWRANLGINYGLDAHNYRLGVNYVSAVKDERPGIQYGEDGENWVTVDFTYRFEYSEAITIMATGANLLDRDPPPAQEEFGYDPWVANPLGRTFEIATKLRF